MNIPLLQPPSHPNLALILVMFLEIKKTWVARTRLSHILALEIALS